MFERILIAIDRDSSNALLQGMVLARAHGAEVVLFTMLPHLPIAMAESMAIAAISAHDLSQASDVEAKRLLLDAEHQADDAGVAHASVIGCGVDAAKCIIEAARTHQCDLVVVESKGVNAIRRLLSGSPIPGLITQAPMAILVCKPGHAGTCVARSQGMSAGRVQGEYAEQ